MVIAMTQSEKQAYLQERFQDALKQKNSGSFDKLNTPDFSYAQAYPQKKDWQIGPFQKNSSLTFHQPMPWNDPWDIDWKGGFLFNPTLIEKDEVLHLFYRCAPKKECLCSRIGLALYTPDTGWTDHPGNPLLFPENENEMLSVEDPKVYKYEEGYVLFFNGIYELPPEKRAKDGGFPQGIGCDINFALSKDLIHWVKSGLVVPHQVSGHWAKGAVLPRNEKGEAVKIDGSYMMFLSEGCGNKQQIGYSKDMLHWEFKALPYLDVSEYGHLHEVACAVVSENRLVIDFFYEDYEGEFRAAQALYSLDAPTEQLALSMGGTLAWGGLLKYRGKWLFPQGWDAEDFDMDLFFYEESVLKHEGPAGQTPIGII